eukprot:Phypoly_transcript_14286.p1 GENE.Phypoly_transcript_14286~~Phypoly_transcript_14286.p1  ORF type:complete len:202 (+),score=27.55 Phypoly_transcript_14286:83-688(+)
MDLVTEKVGKQVMQHILGYIPPPLSIFAMLSCSSWNMLVSSLKDFESPKISNVVNLLIWLEYTECLKYLHQIGCKWKGPQACKTAAEKGQLECLKFLHENGFEWDYNTIHSASLRGHLDCLKYAHENGCDLDKYERTCMLAATGGHLDCLKYGHENGENYRNLKRVARHWEDTSSACDTYMSTGVLGLVAPAILPPAIYKA